MLDIQFIRDNPDKVRDGVAKKQYDPSIVDKVLELDKKWKEVLSVVEGLRKERNEVAKQTGEEAIEKGKKIKEELKKLEPELKNLEAQLELSLREIPNLPLDDVPEGKDDSQNVEERKWGTLREFSFEPKSYEQLGQVLGVIDTQTAAKVSGSRFGYLFGDAVLLEFALIKLAFDTLTKEGFIPVAPPVLIRDEMMRGVGYQEHGGEEQRYYFEKDRQYLVGTAEHALIPMHADELLEKEKLPLRYAGFSTAFRREAGTYGQDTKGIFRVHQFDKVEMVSFTTEEQDIKEHEFLISMQEKMVQALEIPYRIVRICTGDLPHPLARAYDLEMWFPAEGRYRETHSGSTATDYQARRLNIRYQDGRRKKFAHTLNATAFAIGRTVLAILENYQQKDGSVTIPEPLRPYVGKDKIMFK